MRQKKTSNERRQQRLRQSGRAIQQLLAALGSLSVKSSLPTRLGAALFEALHEREAKVEEEQVDAEYFCDVPPCGAPWVEEPPLAVPLAKRTRFAEDRHEVLYQVPVVPSVAPLLEDSFDVQPVIPFSDALVDSWLAVCAARAVSATSRFEILMSTLVSLRAVFDVGLEEAHAQFGSELKLSLLPVCGLLPPAGAFELVEKTWLSRLFPLIESLQATVLDAMKHYEHALPIKIK